MNAFLSRSVKFQRAAARVGVIPRIALRAVEGNRPYLNPVTLKLR